MMKVRFTFDKAAVERQGRSLEDIRRMVKMLLPSSHFSRLRRPR